MCFNDFNILMLKKKYYLNIFLIEIFSKKKKSTMHPQN